MPLSDEQDQLEHGPRMKQMETYAKPKVCTDIEQMEVNIAKIAVPVSAALAAAFAAGHPTK